MTFKDLPVPVRAGVIAGAVALAYLFWISCIEPLKTSDRGDAGGGLIGGTVKQKRSTTATPYLRFDRWGVRTLAGRSVTVPAVIAANDPLSLRLSLCRAAGVVRYIDIIFPIGTTIYPRASGERTWAVMGRTDASACRYQPNPDERLDEEIVLPEIEVLFKSGGIFEVRYSIMLDGYKTVEGMCVFKVNG